MKEYRSTMGSYEWARCSCAPYSGCECRGYSIDDPIEPKIFSGEWDLISTSISGGDIVWTWARDIEDEDED